MKTNTTPITATIPSLVFDYGRKRIPLNEISHLKSEFGNYTKVHLKREETILSAFTLKYYSEKLKNTKRFIQPRKGVVINKNEVDCLENTDDGLFVRMKSGIKFKVSRRKTVEFAQMFA
ncbi:LytTR family transcriptional regulator [Marinilongibacter aquaticus]|uniref:LytTR family DNA-binding domain-containing protein n=1 Tax=Marinilongibacter aquaticus TaxID=2975157 RepID=UPI0021BD658D|nr:LytTR family DNA-binding domain-containing protein [Marinilongibacter aquaticus]UBM58589.1 LytTR family transcriptional regulator [Marinilongibacter aquaticus]